MQNLTTQEVVDFFKTVKSVDKDGYGGYTNQPWFKLPDESEGWIPVELDICYTDSEDQMLMGHVEERGDVEGVIKSLSIGSIIVHPIYTPKQGIISQEIYTLTKTGWVKSIKDSTIGDTLL